MKLVTEPTVARHKRGISKARGGRSAQKTERRRIAEKQIQRLLEMAILERRENPELARRHGAIAWKLSTRFNVKLKERRDLFCHYCKQFIVPMLDARYRFGRKTRAMHITCLLCGKTYRRPLQ